MKKLLGKSAEVAIPLTAGDTSMSDVIALQNELIERHSIDVLLSSALNYLQGHQVAPEKIDEILETLMNAEIICNEVFLAQELVAQFGDGLDSVTVKSLIESPFLEIDGDKIMSPVSGIADRPAISAFLDKVQDAHENLIPGLASISFIADFVEELQKESDHVKMTEIINGTLLSNKYVDQLSAEIVSSPAYKPSLAQEKEAQLENLQTPKMTP